MTSPDWVPLMRKAAAIVTDSGGMTCHAAIVSRELGIPCVVGTGEATKRLRDGELVTVDATHGTVIESSPAGATVRVPAAALAPAAATAASSAPPVSPAPGSRQSVGALAGRPRGRARCRWRRPDPSRADAVEALDGAHPRQAAGRGSGRRVRAAALRRARSRSPPDSHRAPSPIVQPTSGPTSSAAWPEATSSSPKKPTR